eukprot:11158836-Lingulodinium_polyedra.AAC.1
MPRPRMARQSWLRSAAEPTSRTDFPPGVKTPPLETSRPTASSDARRSLAKAGASVANCATGPRSWAPRSST